MREFIWSVQDKLTDLRWTAEEKAIKAIDYVVENPKKSLAVVAAGIATGGVAYVAAPTIAATIGATGVLGATATTGATISTLTGVPLANASLAALGGGALSVGGAGMAGGTAVIAGTGVATGSAVAAGVASKVK